MLPWYIKAGYTVEEVDVSKGTPIIAIKEGAIVGIKVDRFIHSDFLSIIKFAVTWGRP